MNKQRQINYIIDKLSHLCSYVQLCNKMNYTDINSISEGFIRCLLNILYDMNLVNLNVEKINYPGIDLGDFENRIGVQVTSRQDSKKIIDTYKKINNKNNAVEGKSIADIFNQRIIFFVISSRGKIKFQKKTFETLREVSDGRFSVKDIIDINDVIQELYIIDYVKFNNIYELISREIDVLPPIIDDSVVVEEILSCFNRPAFTVEFMYECSLCNFEKALKDTISLINTGKASDGITIQYNVNDINSKVMRRKFSDIVTGINKIRHMFLQMSPNFHFVSKTTFYIKDMRFCKLMNDMRAIILYYVYKISREVGCSFDIFPSYVLERLEDYVCKITSTGNLSSDLDYVLKCYKHH